MEENQTSPVPSPAPVEPTGVSPISKWLVPLIAVGILFAAGAVGFIFYQNDSVSPQEAKKTYDGKVVIGVVQWPGYKGLYLARDKEFFKAHGVDVEIRTYGSLSDLSLDYTSGTIQGRANLNFDTVRESLGGFDQRVVLVLDYSAGADAIVAKKEIKIFADLKGKKVAYNFKTMEEYFLEYGLKDVSLSVSDLVGVNAYADTTAAKVKAEEVDAAVMFEPFLTEAVNTGEYHVLLSSRDARGLIADLLTFGADFIEQYPDTVQAIVAAYFDAVVWANHNEEEANALLAKELGVTPEVAEEQVKGLEVLSLFQNQEAFRSGFHTLSLSLQLNTVANFVSIHEGVTGKLGPILEPKFLTPEPPPQEAGAEN
jgi:NitT/TauT family transport system substrate-binding protein